MKLKNKILLWVLPLLLIACSTNRDEELVGELLTVKTEVPWFGDAYYFPFYGREIVVKIDKDIVNNCDLENNDTNEIKKLVKNLKDSKFDKTIQMLITQSKEMDLDAFGYRLLLKKFIKEIFQDQSKNFNEVIMWYGLRTNDLDAVLSKQGKKILCYCGAGRDYTFMRDDTKNKISGMTDLNIEGTNYWNDNKNVYPDNQKILDFDLFKNHKMNDFILDNKLPKLGKAILSKKRSFVYKGRIYHLKTSYNKYFVQYLNDLPMKYLNRQYFKREFSKEVRESFDSIPIWIKGKTNYDKFNFLLTLVHQAFPHSGGDKIEKWNYVEQTMKDDYVDCEDRAVMFCYLAEEFTNFRSSLVVGDHHAWSAVSDKIKFTDGYFMCDPGLEFGDMLHPNKEYTILD